MADDQEDDMAEREPVILRALFDGVEPSTTPTFGLLVGSAGAGAGRAIGRLRREHGGDLVPVSVEDLQAFHPQYLDRGFRQSPTGQQEVSRLAASWLQASISHARENRYSLLLEGAFRSAEKTLAVARRFADAGYDVHMAAVAASEEASLLTTTSRGLHRMQDGQPAQFVTPEASAQSVRDVSALIVAAADSPVVDRVSVFNRRGDSVFDVQRNPSGMLNGASVALSAAESEAMSALEAAQWLSELRHMTEYAQSLRSVPVAAIESLIELHELAIRRVVPALPVPAGSEVVRIQQEKLAADLARLRRMHLRSRTVDIATPTVTPAESGPSISR